MKYSFKFIAAIYVMVVLVCSAFAQDSYWGPNAALINSSSTTNTAVNFPAWPVLANGNITNFTKFDVGNSKFVSIQITCQTTNTTSTSNVVWTVYKSVSGGNPTNALGTSLRFTTLGTITNVLNGVTPVTAIGDFSDSQIAGSTTLYIGYVTTPSNSGITNYTVYARGKQ